MEKFDVIVVGSSLAGLTAALELSEKGKSVIVLEMKNVTGEGHLHGMRMEC